MKIRKCEYCNKELTKKQTKFCSRSCNSHINGCVGGKSSNNAFHNKEIQRNNAIKANITNKKNKTGFWNPYVGRKGGKIVHILYPNLNKKINLINKKNKTGWFNSTFQLENSIKGGLAAQLVLRHNHRNLKYKGQYYDSKPEIEISICLQEQFNYIPKERKTLHIRIGNRECDYLIKELKLFIEFHSFWKKDDNEKEYYKLRRENLDNNNYKDYNLIIIK